MQVKLPKETKDLRIRHYTPLKNPIYSNDMDIFLMVKFLSEFSGVDENLIKTMDLDEVAKMYNHCIDISASFEMAKPQQEITIKGIEYELVDPNKVSTGWHIDFGNTDIESEFVRLACLFYYPKGGTYGDIDENSNLIHPIHERYEDFKDEFPLVTFLNAAGFFLLKFRESIKRYTEIKSHQIKWTKRLNSINGRRA